MVLVRFLHVDDGRDGRRPALGASLAGWRRGCGGLAVGPVDGDGATEAVEPLLLVENVVDLQGVRLGLTRVL